MWNKIYIYTFFKHSIQRKEALHQSTLCKINYIYLFSNPFHTTRDHQRSRRSQWKLKLERKKTPKKNYPPWKTDHPLVHCVIKNVYPLLFFFYQFISGRNVLHRAISTVFALPESPSHPDEQKWAVTKSLNWTPPRPVYTRVRTSINKPWLVPMLRPGKASGVHVYLVWQYGFQYCPICMIHPAVSTNRFTVSTCALCTYIYIWSGCTYIPERWVIADPGNRWQDPRPA